MNTRHTRPAPRLMAVLAHPDDESLGFGGTLARYANAGAEVYLLTATRGEAGRYQGIRPGEPGHPGVAALAMIREAELRAAATTLGVREVALLDYRDQQLDRASPHEAVSQIAAHLRRIRPDIVLTFGPDGGYGHPDHIAISQFTTAAMIAAADPAFTTGGVEGERPHAVSKLYYTSRGRHRHMPRTRRRSPRFPPRWTAPTGTPSRGLTGRSPR